MRLALAALALVAASPAVADTTAPSGQPICTSPDNLHEYVLALINKDSKWLSQVEGCAMLKGGLKMEVIDRGEVTAGMHVDRVRVFGKGGSSTGWTINTDE